MTAFICISSEEYLGYYNVLYESFKKHSPGVKQILYFIGKNVPSRFDEVVDITQWFDDTNSSYTPLERICSLRARVVLDAFEKGYERVVFCGAKLEFFSCPFDLIVFDENAVVTPHILEPLPEDGKFPSNSTVSFSGHISTDLVAFKNCTEIIRFLNWQDRILQRRCKSSQHTYLDQSWLNFLPFFVDNVKILRDPRYNVAYWNYYQRQLPFDEMVCFQYSGLPLDNPKKISTHQDRSTASGDFLEFLTSYAKRVKEFK